MKRDILDDFYDFLITEGNKISYFMEPMRAMVGPNGNIQQDMYIKGIIPEVGVVHGAAIICFPQKFFPHLEYDEPCSTCLEFATEYSGLDGDSIEEQFDLTAFPPDLSDNVLDDDNNLKWLNEYDL